MSTDVPAVTRERSYRWEDPEALAAAAAGRSGLEFLQAMADGTLPVPPILATLGEVGFEPPEEGRVTFTLEPAEFHYNPIGSMHGGVYATLLDSACGCTVHSTLPAGVGYTSLDLSVRFLRAVTTRSGTLRCTGTVISAGRRTALARATITDAQDRLVAEATSSCLIIRP